MASVRCLALCLRVWDWSETSQTAALLARELGLVRCVAKGSRRERSPYSGGLEPLTLGEAMITVKPGGQLSLLTAWDLREVPAAARRNLAAFHAGLTMLDLTQHAIQELDPHPALFDALVEGVRSLEDPSRVGPALLTYLWRVLDESGHRPELRINADGGAELPDADAYAFAARLGGLTRDGAGGEGPVWRVRRETVELMRSLPTLPPPSGRTDAATIERATRLLAMYFREVFACDPPTLRKYDRA